MSGQRDVVAGLEMFPTAMKPGTAVCDRCGFSVTWNKYSPAEGEEATRGWKIDRWCSGADSICPECAGN